MNAFLILALVLGFDGNAAAPRRAAADDADLAAIEKVVRDNIGWALTKDRPLLERTMAQDERLFIFNPTVDTTVGWQQFVKNFDLWMDPRFKATSVDIRELRIDRSRSGDVAWWSCILDDLGEWDGRPIAWKNVRWTGVLERRDGSWRIVQMHFSFARVPDPVSLAVQTSGPFEVRTYLVWDEVSKEATLIDPGSAVDELLATLDARRLKLKYVLLTHGHQDHVASVPALQQRFPEARLGYSARERADFAAYSGWRTLFDADSVASWEKLPGGRSLLDYDYGTIPAPDIVLEEPQALRLGSLPIQVLSTPGHSRGSLTFSIGRHLFPGDLVLYHQTGFMNYPLASRDDVVSSIRKIYDTFPEESVLHSGHGEDSTIGTEKRENRNVTATGVRWEAAGPADPPARSSVTEPRSATLPFVMDHDRMIVELELSRADGTARKARAWVDTGQVGLGLTEAVAKDLALAPGAATPRLRLGGMTLDAEGIEVRVGEGARVNPGVPAEVHLPAAALRHHHVVFDYPARRLTIAQPGVLTPRGAAVPCRVHPVTGLFQVDATADGETLPLAVDNGSSSTWVSVALVERWKARHPDWPSATGAVGTTNFFGFGFEAQGVLMRLPELGIGGHRSRGVALLGLDQGLFDWYSRKTEAAVVGFIGGNVLKGYRLEVDFPGRTTYWEGGGELGIADLDTVGLTLRPNPDGSFTVAGVTTKDGRPTVEGVQAGDTLLRVENLDATQASMGAVADALRGEPGASRSLLIERNGVPIRVEATVRRFP